MQNNLLWELFNYLKKNPIIFFPMPEFPCPVYPEKSFMYTKNKITDKFFP